VLFALVAFAQEGAAQARDVKVRHCAAADSVLGRKSDAWKGDVRVRIDSAREIIQVVTDPGNRPPSFTGSAQVDGRTWIGVPPLALHVFVRGKEAEGLDRLGRDPVVTLVVDDSVTVETGAVKLGIFLAPRNYPRDFFTIPVSTLLLPTSFLSLARARSAYVRVEQAKVSATKTELRNIGALYAVLACGTID
jgi:hypothetical protein